MTSIENATRGAVAAGHEETAKAVQYVLDAGGNAFDGALAGFLAACIAEPVLASVGGGGFLTGRTADGAVVTRDFFTQTPRKKQLEDSVEFYPIVADFGTATQEFHIGLGSVAVPGAVAGVFDIHETFGRIPMSEIAAPAIELASRGLEINRFQSYLLQVIGPIYRATEESRSLFCLETSEDCETSMRSTGDVYRVPAFADFLSALVREGPDLFYRGEIADEIANMNGCSIDREDLNTYRVASREPIVTDIRGHRVYLNPPPAIGGALIDLALRLFDQVATDECDFGGAAHLERMHDVMRHCNDARRSSRIDFDPIEGAAALRRALEHPPAYRGTTHISVADCDGNIAAMTVSNGEGCGHLIPGTGIMLNNMLGEEDLNAAGFFEWAPSVRLSSMMAPGVMVAPDGCWTAFGSGGSNRIRSALTQVIVNMAVYGVDCAAAVSAPRIHLENGKLSCEPGFKDGAVDALEGLVDEIELWPEPNMFFGGAHLVSERDGCIVGGGGDPRRDGVFRAV